jgi:hypothetical protein
VVLQGLLRVKARGAVQQHGRRQDADAARRRVGDHEVVLAEALASREQGVISVQDSRVGLEDECRFGCEEGADRRAFVQHAAVAVRAGHVVGELAAVEEERRAVFANDQQAVKTGVEREDPVYVAA